MAKDTGKTAKGGMMAFVVTLFLTALVLAGVYLLGFTPGETS
ncbi:hypothetical protein [Rhizobium sp. FY34]|nr:hypothetical protein [Rhizobium sp. FY34]